MRGRAVSISHNFNKTFSTVPHKILLDELVEYRLDKQAEKWTENWLNNQVQTVLICSTIRGQSLVICSCGWYQDQDGLTPALITWMMGMHPHLHITQNTLFYTLHRTLRSFWFTGRLCLSRRHRQQGKMKNRILIKFTKGNLSPTARVEKSQAQKQVAGWSVAKRFVREGLCPQQFEHESATYTHGRDWQLSGVH